jgi:hypothetical protein
VSVPKARSGASSELGRNLLHSACPHDIQLDKRGLDTDAEHMISFSHGLLGEQSRVLCRSFSWLMGMTHRQGSGCVLEAIGYFHVS